MFSSEKFLKSKIKEPEIDKNSFEHKFWKEEKLVCGIDEVGRGPAFGPLTFGAVVCNPWFQSDLIDDSKKLSEKARNSALELIMKNSIAAETFFVPAWQIDHFGLSWAIKRGVCGVWTKVLLKLAAKNLSRPVLLIDSLKPSDWFEQENKPLEVISRNKFESYSVSVASASIIGKTKRDQIVHQMAKVWPGYGLETNVGYATKMHYQKLLKRGQTYEHRQSFVKTLLSGQKNYKNC